MSKARPTSAATGEATTGSSPGEPRDDDGRVSRAKRLRASRRSQLLATSVALFAEQGYHRTSIDDIIKASGVARGTFYLYFESKRAIFEELLDGFFERLASTVGQSPTQSLSAESPASCRCRSRTA